MATIQEIAGNYANQIRRSIATDRQDHVNFSADDTLSSSLTMALQEIHNHIRTLRKSGVAIDSNDRKNILRELSRQLDLESLDDLSTIDESFSNNSYINMVALISNIAKQLRK